MRNKILFILGIPFAIVLSVLFIVTYIVLVVGITIRRFSYKKGLRSGKEFLETLANINI